MFDDLFDEEWIAFGLRHNDVERGLRRRPARHGGHQRGDLSWVEAGEVQPVGAAGTTLVAEKIRERMSAVEVRVPIGSDQEHGHILRMAKQVSEEHDRCFVSPMEVVQYHHQRRMASGRGSHHLDERFIDHIALCVRIIENGTAGRRRRQLRHEASQIGRSRPGRSKGRIKPHQRPDHFDERLIRCDTLRRRRAHDDGGSIGVGRLSPMADQGGLADPRLARHRHEMLTVALAEGLVEDRERATATDEPARVPSESRRREPPRRG